ncbi:MAG TPA: YaiI/YqxD family protein, partial [Pirellulales bacterium]|nr:YaiI/YqxD family protein [Pirellulales bacterium]
LRAPHHGSGLSHSYEGDGRFVARWPALLDTYCMQIWVDADACPGAVKELLFRTAQRRKIKVTLVANGSMHFPRSEFIAVVLVPSGMNVADRRIAELAQPGDLVVTADVPLAAQVVTKGAEALDPRGELYTDANIGERLAVGNLLDGLRGEDRVRGGPSGFNARDRQAFANQLDRWLNKR